MKKQTIFNVYVRMTSQEQCDKMKKICIDYGLPYWDINYAFELKSNLNKKKAFYVFEFWHDEFFVTAGLRKEINKTEVTEEKFIELVKEYNCEKYSLDEYKKQLEIESKNFGGI